MTSINVVDAAQNKIDAINAARDAEDLRVWEQADAQDPREVAAFERRLDQLFSGGAR